MLDLYGLYYKRFEGSASAFTGIWKWNGGEGAALTAECDAYIYTYICIYVVYTLYVKASRSGSSAIAPSLATDCVVMMRAIHRYVVCLKASGSGRWKLGEGSFARDRVRTRDMHHLVWPDVRLFCLVDPSQTTPHDALFPPLRRCKPRCSSCGIRV